MLVEVSVPDIGGFSDVPVIELFVAPGDTIDSYIGGVGSMHNRCIARAD